MHNGVVTIDRFLRSSGWTEQQLAAAAHASQPSINRLRRKAMRASLPLALRIESATGGQVGAERVPMTREAQRALRVLRGPKPAKGDAA